MSWPNWELFLRTSRGGDTYAALERGTIDAVEWVGPYDDEKLGFNKVAKYYYYPGWWDCTGQLAFCVGAKAWSALPSHYQRAFEVAAAEASWDMLSHYDASNMAPLRRLIAGGTELRPFSREIMEAGYRAAFALYAEEAEKNPEFRKIYGEWFKFRGDIVTWFRVAEASFESNLYSLYKT
jgi:TRAP-type mannitol/chloroaromatic compound transport system substrate-binding protein